MSTLVEEKVSIEDLCVPGFHRVVRMRDKSRGLDAIVAIHDLSLGRAALGGTRIYPYATFDEALVDVTRLSRGMTYKSVAAQVSWGGGKSVIIADPKKGKTPELLTAFAEGVNQLKGVYICAEDMGCSPEDIGIIAQTTPFALGGVHEKSSGNPAPFTAWGVFRGIQAVMHQLFGLDQIRGRTFAVQGLGSVGYQLAEHLFWHGAKLVVTDTNIAQGEQLARRWNAEFVAPDEIYEVPCDVFVPCAVGGVINPVSIERFRCRAIAGAANNQLLTDQDAEELRRLGILYAPDFVINAGGLINATQETQKEGYNAYLARSKVDKIYDELRLIFDIARQNAISTQKAAMQLVEYRLQYGIGRRVEPIYMHHADMCF
jgi:leucine dehydrogenase